MRVYLDTSVYNRPFDDRSRPRIWLESQALAIILRMVEAGEVELATSSVVSYETSRNPFAQRREWVARVARLAVVDQPLGEEIIDRARALERAGLKGLDALHVACAEAAGADYFITGDDRLIRRYGRSAARRMNILEPAAFVRQVAGEDVE